MSDFIINTPYHTRWWLPDHIHQFNSVINGNERIDTVYVGNTDKFIARKTYKLDEPHYDSMLFTFHQQMREECSRYKVYEITTADGGSLDNVWVDAKDIRDYGERAAVGHAAWRAIFDLKPKAPRGSTRVTGPAAMLKQICDKIGTEEAHKRFTASIKFKRVT